MPRIPRPHVGGAFYHVILRGNHRQDIFFKPEDRRRFAELVAENIERFRMRAKRTGIGRSRSEDVRRERDVVLGVQFPAANVNA